MQHQSTTSLLLTTLALAATCPVSAAQDVTPADLLERSPARLDLRTPLRERLTQPVLSREDDGLWVRTRDQRARFDSTGMSIYPVFGPTSPREWPIDVRVSSAAHGAAPYALDATSDARGDASAVRVSRAGMEELHHLTLDGVEQTFVFDTLPGDGDLVVELDVETDLTPSYDGHTLRFEAEGLGHVEVGQAFVFDAAGRRAAITRDWTGDGIELRVPAAFLADAVLPVTIDPIWSTFSMNYGVPDDANPDIAYLGLTNEYMIVWEDYTSATNSDIWAIKYDEDFTTASNAIAVASGSVSWEAPAIAYSRASDQVMVAASTGLGTGSARVMAAIVDVASLVVTVPGFQVSTIGSTDKKSVDVGGSNYPINSADRFAVVWSRELAPGNNIVQYRVYESDGQPLTSVITAAPAGSNDVQPTISTGLGDTVHFGDNWHMAWVRDANDDGRGNIMVQRIHYSGQLANGSAPYSAVPGENSAHPSVTSLFDDTLAGDRPALVVYEQYYSDLSRPNGLRSDLYSVIVANDSRLAGRGISTRQDAGRHLLQRNPRVTTDGEAFFVTYLEEDPNFLNQDVWNVYMTTGELVDNGINGTIALAERRIALATDAASETAVEMAMRWQGDPGPASTEGAVVWSRDVGHQDGQFGQVEGVGIEYILPPVLTASAVGDQYGQANPNSVATDNTGWLRIFGNQSSSVNHLATALDLPPNSFGYLIVGEIASNVNHPAGSQGKLLVGGNIGRYVGAIQSSGANGRIDVAIDPTSLPQPNGSVAAAPGDTWYFQLWHRDSVNGQATSNFTNGCALHFVN